MKAKLLMLILPAMITEAEVSDLIGKVADHLKDGTTPVLLDESDFLKDITNKTGFRRGTYNVRQNFYTTVHTLNNVCGNAGERSYFTNFLEAYVKGKIDKPILDVLLSATADEMAWLTSIKATYLITLIERLPSLVVE